MYERSLTFFKSRRGCSQIHGSTCHALCPQLLHSSGCGLSYFLTFNDGWQGFRTCPEGYVDTKIVTVIRFRTVFLITTIAVTAPALGCDGCTEIGQTLQNSTLSWNINGVKISGIWSFSLIFINSIFLTWDILFIFANFSLFSLAKFDD